MTFLFRVDTPKFSIDRIKFAYYDMKVSLKIKNGYSKKFLKGECTMFKIQYISRIDWDELVGTVTLCLIHGGLILAYGFISYLCIECWRSDGFSTGLLIYSSIFLGGFFILIGTFLRFWPDYSSGILRNGNS